MDIHSSVLTDDITRQAVYDAVEYALITTHIGNAPTQIFMLGRDQAGRLLEVTAVVRHEDIIVVHAADARPEYMTLIGTTTSAAGESSLTDPEGPSSKYGKSVDGLELTDGLLEDLFAAAEQGYDVERLDRRTRPGRPAPLAVGGVVLVGLDEPLKDALSKYAATEGAAIGDVVERVLNEYLAA